jgi:hypothetical protein
MTDPRIRVTRGTGFFEHIPPDDEVFDRRLAQLDRPGTHLWVYVAAWAAADPRAAEAHLDSENLVSITGPGCFKCEQPFSNRLARKPCRGRIRP